MILTPLILYIFQVKYKTICLKDRVGIINFRFSDTLSSINNILKNQQSNVINSTSDINVLYNIPY